MLQKNIQGTVCVEGLRVYAYHGVLNQETVVGNTFEVDIKLNFPCFSAMTSDDIETSINYAEVVDIVKEVMKTPSLLIENVAYRLYEALNTRWQNINGGHIKISKLQPPISADMNRAAFEFNW